MITGLLQKAQVAKEQSTDAEIEEEIMLAWNKVYSDSYLDNTIDKAIALSSELGIEETDVILNGNKLNIIYRNKEKILDVDNGILSDLITVAKAKQEETVFDANTGLLDSYGNKCIIPEGFKIASDSAEAVTEGIVIEDATYTNTMGSQFVWIPVSKDGMAENKIKGEKNTTILLGRYVFDNNGNIDTTLSKSSPQEQLKTSASASNYFTEELKNSTTNNTHAKDIEDFIVKTKTTGGFWIGRYEARIEGYTGKVNTSNSNSEISWTGYTGGKLVEKPDKQVFNYITQNKAAELSQKMYEKKNDGTTAITSFESDLMNSYAWDTAILFLQEYDNRTYNESSNTNYKEKYSQQIRLSTELKNKGTNSSTIANNNRDKICNVFDMADNCIEWTTETYSNNSYPCVERGGIHDNNTTSSSRGANGTANINSNRAFRPLLYIN